MYVCVCALSTSRQTRRLAVVGDMPTVPESGTRGWQHVRAKVRSGSLVASERGGEERERVEAPGDASRRSEAPIQGWRRALETLRAEGQRPKPKGWFASHWDESYEDRITELFVSCEMLLVCLWPVLFVATCVEHNGQITYPLAPSLITILWAVDTGLLLLLPLCLFAVLNSVQWLADDADN